MRSRIPISAVVVALWIVSPALGAEFTSPGGGLSARVEPDSEGRLVWSLRRGEAILIEPSRLGISVNGADLGVGVTLGGVSIREIDERYVWRGVKAQATNRCRIHALAVRHAASGVEWQLEARLFDDGFACRYRVPGQDARTVNGEASSWTLPADSDVWYQTNTGDYEGVYQRHRPALIPIEERTARGTNAVHLGPPITIELARGGYLLVTEANLFGYSGMTLRPTGTGRIQAAFEDDPGGFEVEGEILSPWRVTVAAPDLQGLVNTDVIHNLCEPPDPRLFPDGMKTAWIEPGRALITWCVFGNDGAQWHLQKWFVDQCAALGCEHLLVDAGWQSERWGW
ncbi:MAG TPA: glycoside hydrolase family 97 N-terminal domain-containing protein, partial [Verrucomicrobiota bacterium]|nr:glycoside hydrolase family 97 N-terminal domain-containing protein [Verrucomicrobiota bacterium]